MTLRYASQVKAYCEDHGIEIPPGFSRHPAARYAAINLDTAPQRLVAATWANQKKVIDYLSRFGEGKQYRLLDLEDLQELHYAGGTRLKHGAHPGPAAISNAASDQVHLHQRVTS